MQEIAIRFARAARQADVALFYYSGHAMQFAGVNYLMPVDAKLKDEADIVRNTLRKDPTHSQEEALHRIYSLLERPGQGIGRVTDNLGRHGGKLLGLHIGPSFIGWSVAAIRC